jgi:hypothetical protein
MVYVWTSPRDYPNSMIGEHYPIGSADYIDYLQLKHLPEDYRAMDFVKFEQPLAKVLCYDDLYTTIGAPLISPRLREAIEKAAPGEVQFLPATIVAKDGRTEEYTVVNALHPVHAIDREASIPKLRTDGVTVGGWYELVHRPDGMGDTGIGRDPDYIVVLLVSERVKTELDKGGFKFRGLGLRLPSDMPW